MKLAKRMQLRMDRICRYLDAINFAHETKHENLIYVWTPPENRIVLIQLKPVTQLRSHETEWKYANDDGFNKGFDRDCVDWFHHLLVAHIDGQVPGKPRPADIVGPLSIGAGPGLYDDWDVERRGPKPVRSKT